MRATRFTFKPAALVVLIFAFACTNTYLSVYRMKLVRVDRNERGTGRSEVLSVEGDTATDGLIDVKWLVSNRDMSVSVTNKTDQVVKVIWDEATFVRSDGTSMRMVHRGVQSPADVEFSHLPSVLPRGGRIDDSVYPADLIFHAKNIGWVRSPLVTEESSKTPAEAMRLGNMRRGESIQVFLLIEVNGKPFEYVSVFAVDGVTVWEKDADGGDEPLSIQPKA